MKRKIVGGVVAALLWATSCFANVIYRVTYEGTAPSDKPFVVTLDGVLPNSCFSTPEVVHEFRNGALYIQVTYQEPDSQGQDCIPMVPYHKEVNFGIIPRGFYDVHVYDNREEVYNNYVAIQ